MKLKLLIASIFLGSIFGACNRANNGKKTTTDSAITDTSGTTVTDSGVVDTTGKRSKSDSVLLDTFSKKQNQQQKK